MAFLRLIWYYASKIGQKLQFYDLAYVRPPYIFYVIDEVDHYYPSFDDFEKDKNGQTKLPGS